MPYFPPNTGGGFTVAGSGLFSSGGGTTVNAGQNADGSVLVNADDVQVGVLATDAQHGNRGGGAIHATVVAAGAAGFMSGADKTKLDGIAASAAALGSTAGADVTLTGTAGSASTAARSDHAHALDVTIAPTWTNDHVWSTTDAGTTSVTTHCTNQHRSSGAPAAGFGVGWLSKLDSSNNTLRTAGEIDVVWSTATNGSEVSSFAFKTMLAGTLTEVARFGTGASLPDSDFSFSVGRILMDSRTTDIGFISHRDNTTTSNYALRFTQAGNSTLNGSASANMAFNGTTRITVTAAGIGFFGAAAAAQQVSAANLTNNVTAGGTDDTIANFTDLTIYANDSAAIRNDIYQLARKVKQLNDGLRTLGLFT